MEFQKDIEYQRYYKLLDLFVREGSIFLMHPSIIHFGENDKHHYTISKRDIKFGYTYFIFNPCTSQEKSKERKDVFGFNLKLNSTCREGNNKTTYVLLALNQKVELRDIIKPDLCGYKGKMHEDTLLNYRKAKQEFILWNHNRRNKN
jgi:hypothetical protein